MIKFCQRVCQKKTTLSPVEPSATLLDGAKLRVKCDVLNSWAWGFRIANREVCRNGGQRCPEGSWIPCDWEQDLQSSSLPERQSERPRDVCRQHWGRNRQLPGKETQWRVGRFVSHGLSCHYEKKKNIAHEVSKPSDKWTPKKNPHPNIPMGSYDRSIHQNVQPEEVVLCVKFQGPQLNRTRKILKKIRKGPSLTFFYFTQTFGTFLLLHRLSHPH